MGCSVGALKAASILKSTAPKLDLQGVEQREAFAQYCQNVAKNLEEIRWLLLAGRRPEFALAKLQSLAWHFPKLCSGVNGMGAEQWAKELVARWPRADLLELMHEAGPREELPSLYASASAAFVEIAELVRDGTH